MTSSCRRIPLKGRNRQVGAVGCSRSAKTQLGVSGSMLRTAAFTADRLALNSRLIANHRAKLFREQVVVGDHSATELADCFGHIADRQEALHRRT